MTTRQLFELLPDDTFTWQGRRYRVLAEGDDVPAGAPDDDKVPCLDLEADRTTLFNPYALVEVPPSEA